jgi:hypothetical protein
MSVRRNGKKKRQSPQRCPKCGATERLTVAVTCVPDARATIGGRVVWNNESAAKCECGFSGKVSDFWVSETIALIDTRTEVECKVLKDAGDDDISLPIRCPPWGEPIELPEEGPVSRAELERMLDEPCGGRSWRALDAPNALAEGRSDSASFRWKPPKRTLQDAILGAFLALDHQRGA